MSKISYDAIIIGAGFSGLYQLYKLRDKLKLNCRVLEKGSGIGGTWYWNRYPGARCDTESHAYTYFFSEEIFKEWEWSERYPGHAEIRKYLNYVSNKYSLNEDIQLNTEVNSATFDEENNSWILTTKNDEIFKCKFLITAVGCISTTNIPNIKGLKKFNGDYYHTGNWPKNDVDFSGKRVGQIGTGSTGIQAAPVIAEKAKHLTVFQRTPNFSVPARNKPLSKEFKEYVKNNYDELKSIVKETPNGHAFRISEKLTFDVDQKEREKKYEEYWEKGGLQFRGVFKDIITDKKANDSASFFLKKKISQVVKNKEFAKILTNFDHPYGCKRPPIDTNYFETYNKDNVHLVDIKNDPIIEIDEKGIKTKNNYFKLDTIVFATGYDAMTGTLINLNITGENNLNLKDYWNEGPKTYLGLQIPGFPNMFTITGPGSPSVLTNMPTAIEQHVEWVTDCISYMMENNFNKVSTSEKNSLEWGKQVKEAADKTLLPTVKHSWYLGANIPNKPRVFMPYAGGLPTYTKICETVKNNNYEGFAFS